MGSCARAYAWNSGRAMRIMEIVRKRYSQVSRGGVKRPGKGGNRGQSGERETEDGAGMDESGANQMGDGNTGHGIWGSEGREQGRSRQQAGQERRGERAGSRQTDRRQTGRKEGIER